MAKPKVTVKTTLKEIVIVPYVIKNKWDGKNWLLVTDILFSINGKKYKVPAGFVTDMGSIPRVFRITMDRMGIAIIGYVIHDWLYVKNSPVTRYEADQALYQISRKFGQGWYSANKTYYGLRSFGMFSFNSENNFDKINESLIKLILKNNGYVFLKKTKKGKIND